MTKGIKYRTKVHFRCGRSGRKHLRTGETPAVEVEAGYENEEAKLRRCFAETCFGDAEFFEDESAANRLTLGVLADPNFRLLCPDGIDAILVELRFALAQMHGPSFAVRSKDVLHTLELNGLRRKLDADRISRAVVKITFPDDRRGKRVEVWGHNKIKFKRATHAEDVFRLLADWGILRDDEVAPEFRVASAAFAGVPGPATGGDGRVSPPAADGTGKARRPR